MSRCPTQDVLLDLVLGRPVDPAVAQHVQGCAACQAARREVERVTELLPAGSVEPSPGFDRALFARLDALDEAGAVPWWRRWVGPIILAPAVAVSAVVLVVASDGGVRDSGPTGSGVDPALLADLELLESLEAVELVDVVDDLDVIRALPMDEG
jgi:hypothetical protein